MRSSSGNEEQLFRLRSAAGRSPPQYHKVGRQDVARALSTAPLPLPLRVRVAPAPDFDLLFEHNCGPLRALADGAAERQGLAEREPARERKPRAAACPPKDEDVYAAVRAAGGGVAGLIVPASALLSGPHPRGDALLEFSHDPCRDLLVDPASQRNFPARRRRRPPQCRRMPESPPLSYLHRFDARRICQSRRVMR
jgi:hypothetical protein